LAIVRAFSQLSALSASVMGAAVGGYFLSAAPAKMFLSDSGAQMLGYLLAAGLAFVIFERVQFQENAA
jgi:UDP-N-acetylmuramyl pentapeptide phosphotransferase/UDP-N-acetylglucosamine-1-phosphate transferase